tara:strand:+ start:106 stop:441 length:336 start_codon:yes stop_codon:yes gene_type:complete
VAKKSTRILLLGRKTEDGKTLQEYMTESLPQEVPLEYIHKVNCELDDMTIELTPKELSQPIDLNDLTAIYNVLGKNEFIKTLEIIIDLQKVQDKLRKESTDFLNKNFPENI